MLVEGSTSATPDMSSDSTTVVQPGQDDTIEIGAPTGMLVGSPSPQQQQPSGGLVEYQHGHDPPDTKEGIEELCPVCGDKVSGYHYGLLTCESCKGFFKRTVQNKKVYTCVADRSCHIDKSQRKRCPYCRFQKCLDVGMKLEAVRADRMRGGRNKFGPMYKRDRARKLQMMRQKQIARAQCQGVMSNEVGPPPFTPPSMPAPSLYNDLHIKQELIQIPQLSSSTSSPDSSPSPLAVAQSSHGFGGQVMGGPPLPPDPAKVPAGGPWRSGSPPKSPYHYGEGGVGPLALTGSVFSKVPHLIKEFQLSMPGEQEFSNHLYELLQKQTYNQCEVDSFELLCKVIDQSLFAQVDWARNSVFFKELKVDDQMKLLQQSWSDMLILDHLHQRLHNGLPEEITMTNGQKFSLVNLALLGVTGMQNQLNAVAVRLQELKFDVVDYICLKFMLLLNPDRMRQTFVEEGLSEAGYHWACNFLNDDARNLSNMKLVQEAYERTQQALMEYTLLCYPNITDKFSSLLAILPEIHVISDRGEDYLLYRHLNGNAPAQTLLMEMLHAKKK